MDYAEGSGSMNKDFRANKLAPSIRFRTAMARFTNSTRIAGWELMLTALMILCGICWTPFVRAEEPVSVPTIVSGTIEKNWVSEGELVSEGQVIATLRSDAVALQLKGAELDLATSMREADNNIDILEAEKSSAVARAELDRIVTANRKTPDTFLQGEVDRFKLMFERSELEVRRAKYRQEIARMAAARAKHDVDSIKEVLGRYRIVAPCSGIIASMPLQPGEWLEPGDMIAQIVGTSRLRIDGYVDAKVGQMDLIGKRVSIYFLTESAIEPGATIKHGVTEGPIAGLELITPNHFAVANAVGAAIAQVSGEVDRVYALAEIGRDEALDDAKARATAAAAAP